MRINILIDYMPMSDRYVAMFGVWDDNDEYSVMDGVRWEGLSAVEALGNMLSDLEREVEQLDA